MSLSYLTCIDRTRAQVYLSEEEEPLHNSPERLEIRTLAELLEYLLQITASSSSSSSKKSLFILEKPKILDFKAIASFLVPIGAYLQSSLSSEDRCLLIQLNSNGYNFSAEFEYVYFGPNPYKSNYEDYRVILTRALLYSQLNNGTTDSDVKNNAGSDQDKSSHVNALVDALLQAALFVESLSAQLCGLYCKALFPNLNIPSFFPSSVLPLRIFIGPTEEDNEAGSMKSDALTASIRVCVVADPSGLDASSSEIAKLNRIYFVVTKKYNLDASFVRSITTRISTVPVKNASQRTCLVQVVEEDLQGLSVSTLTGRSNEATAATDMEDDLHYLMSTVEALTATAGDDDGPSLRGSQEGSSLHEGSTFTPKSESEASCSAQLFHWGASGTESPVPEDLSCLAMPALLLTHCIHSIACSQTHCLVLSQLGAVFAYGANAEGALGLGDIAPRARLTLVGFPADSDTDAPPTITKVAAGSCAIGSHSLALDSAGKCYSWGVGYITGLGVVKPVLSPRLLDTFLLKRPASENDDDNQGGEAGIGIERKEMFGAVPVRDIACGGGFSAVVMISGEIATWGMWAQGRLGLGNPPILTGTGFRSRKKVARYQLVPKVIKSIQQAHQISCGESHALCLNRKGDLQAWGGNSYGQLGSGVQPSGFLCDAFTPISVVFPNSCPNIIKIACGTNHSLALDMEGTVWSWGARGHACLGQGDHHKLSGDWRGRIDAHLSASSQRRVIVPLECLPWCESWSRPRIVGALQNVSIVQMSAGEQHSSFLSSNGRVFFTGEGSVVPPMLSLASSTNSFKGAEISEEKEEVEKEEDALQNVVLDVVSTPRCPSAVWLDRISTRRVLFIASSAHRCIVLQAEELVSFDLGQNLFRQLFADNSSEEDDLLSLGSITRSEHGNNSFFEQRGAADCIIITSGRTLLAHQSILSRRSPIFRELLLDENPMDDGQAPTQLLLPELRYDTAKVLLQYIYTDVLPNKVLTDLSTLYALSRCAKLYNMPSLLILTDTLIQSLTKSEFEEEDDEDSNEYELPPCTLVKDLSSLVGNPTFADVRFIAEERTIYAHRFVLQSRCGYFAAMFKSGMMETLESVEGVIDVTVPGLFILYKCNKNG